MSTIMISDHSFTHSAFEKFRVLPSIKLKQQASYPEKTEEQSNHKQLKSIKSLFCFDSSKSGYQIQSARDIPLSSSPNTEKVIRVSFSPTRSLGTYRSQALRTSLSSRSIKLDSKFLKETPPKTQNNTLEDHNGEDQPENIPQYLLQIRQSMLSNSYYHTQFSRSPLYKSHVMLEQSKIRNNCQNDLNNSHFKNPNAISSHPALSSDQELKDAKSINMSNFANQADLSNTKIQSLSSLNANYLGQYDCSHHNHLLDNNVKLADNHTPTLNPTVTLMNSPQKNQLKERKKQNLALDKLLTLDQYTPDCITQSLSTKSNMFKNISQRNKCFINQSFHSTNTQPQSNSKMNQLLCNYKQNYNAVNLSNNQANNDYHIQKQTGSISERFPKKQIGYVALFGRINRQRSPIHLNNSQNQIKKQTIPSIDQINSGRQQQRSREVSVYKSSSRSEPIKNNQTQNLNQIQKNNTLQGESRIITNKIQQQQSQQNEDNHYNFIVNEYDDKKYNLSRFNCLLSNRKVSNNESKIGNSLIKLQSKSSSNILLQKSFNDSLQISFPKANPNPQYKNIKQSLSKIISTENCVTRKPIL